MADPCIIPEDAPLPPATRESFDVWAKVNNVTDRTQRVILHATIELIAAERDRMRAALEAIREYDQNGERAVNFSVAYDRVLAIVDKALEEEDA